MNLSTQQELERRLALACDLYNCLLFQREDCYKRMEWGRRPRKLNAAEFGDRNRKKQISKNKTNRQGTDFTHKDMFGQRPPPEIVAGSKQGRKKKSKSEGKTKISQYCGEAPERIPLSPNTPRKNTKAPPLTRSGISVYEQCGEITRLVKECPEYRLPGWSQIWRDVCHRLDKTYQSFFRKGGYPHNKPWRLYNSVTFPSATGWKLKIEPYSYKPPDKRPVEIRQRYFLDLGGIGSIKLRGTQNHPLQGDIATVTIKRNGTKWYAIFSCKDVPMNPLPENERSVGLDVGLNRFLTDSDFNVVKAPGFLEQELCHLRRLQRKLLRQKKGSGRWKNTKHLITLVHERVKNRRDDFHKKLAHQYATNYGTIVYERLNVAAMLRDNTTSVMHRRIADAGWSNFFKHLEAQGEDHWREIITVDPANSTRTCNICGHVHPKSHVSMVFECVKCGERIDRPLNSATNILDWRKTKEVELK